MPIPYKTYGCKFKCRQSHNEKKGEMLRHERLCWFNPKNRTCKTCINEIYYYEDGWSRECKNQYGDEQIQDEYDKLSKDDFGRVTGNVKPRVYCGLWKPKITGTP